MYVEQLNEQMVIKRDGRKANFDLIKIRNAVEASMKAINLEDETFLEEILLEVVSELPNKADMTIDEIQHCVENTLMKSTYPDVARAYIEYRHDRDHERENITDMHKSVEKLLQKDKTVVNENANKDATVFNTQRDLTAGAVAKSYALKYMLPKHVSNAHLKGEIHFHDLDYSPYHAMTNCCLIDIEGMLKKGFTIGNANVESPKSIQTATAQIAQIIANVASSQYGGCSVDRIDEVLSVYARLNFEKHKKDAMEWVVPEKQEGYAAEKTRKDIYDAMQSLEYEINTLYTSNGQTPFVTLGFGLGEDWFAREIQKAILKVRIGGVGKDKHTAIFPKLVFSIRRGTNLNAEDPNYDIKQLALECSSKRMYPDVLNYDSLVRLTGDFKVPMGCRSFLPAWENENGEHVNAGRNNLGVVTLNIPRIAIQSGGNKERFWEIFHERMKTVKDALLFRLNRVRQARPENAPILYKYGAFGKRLQDGENVDQLFNKERSTISIGYIGLYEAATVFYGGEWEGDTEAKNFTLDILKELKGYADNWKDEYGYWFSVYSTPSESLTDRFNRLDKEKYGVIKDITDKDYYQNSFHYDVRKKITPFEKIDFEKDYPEFCSGGFIHYCEYPKMVHNTKALEAVWDYSYDRVAYLGTNTPIDKCYECDFEGEFVPTEEGFKCPSCGNTDPEKADVVKRTCGYLGNPMKRPMVHGRHVEISNRVKHMENLGE
ncbi:anaerobic ribonucleoside-triphosphate reductase [Listeria monocytogenes]|uniref:anaerobic ribonucleoside-triphosphate reductase n=1 Tax=Listeria monocytogenes TaxID=1639 RepID=UPI000875A279|nr:anaerobic ribonucleoside-triphosphate reductase [Listeria monocytogenes]EAC3358549.1 anaerobic ribonucleoside-triphosphate reductase [Listeria monocytogenes]EAC5508072.1 anaerobic ribonucleoside-triphosphate reductase [Listeria monocytogenes]EAE1475384.1 anaerobic ribonucleoside-triphosphate reductase [Listeria monocytogenes]EAF2800746.1 anaerobic ribonucleoside-triphosphate reductase [Listeria monocytogenes]EAF7363012.1 anaerobic ribonucleoside-triphosphate reductase [Listeria monocytogene